MRRITTNLVLVTVFAVAGCTEGGDPPTPSPGSATPSATWRAGEFKDVRLCDAVSAGTLRRLRVEPSGGIGSCMWRESARDDDDHVERTLDIYHLVYGPSRSSATDAARAGFQRPPAWVKLGPGLPVRGLGDEAKAVQTFSPAIKRRQITLVLRLRNVVVLIDVTQQALLERHWARIPPVAEIEAGALSVARDLLTRLGSPPAPPTASAYQPGEVRAVRKVCGSVTAAARLAAGVGRYDLTPPGTRLASGCHWSENDGKLPHLTVNVEAIAPSPATGQTASQLATMFFDQWKGDRKRAPKLGDEAKMAHFSFESGRSRSSTIFVRRGNLFVYVEYGRWHYPTKKSLDTAVIAIAKAVLADHRLP